MRKLGSCLIIMIFLTAYGRCVADQFGMLHTTQASCCITTCDTSDHCQDQDDEPHHQDEPEPQDDTPPCQLCFILDSDSMLLENGVKVPTPSLLELPDIFSSFATLEDASRGHLLFFPPDLITTDHPDPPSEQRSRLLRTNAKTTPVRGPSIA